MNAPGFVRPRGSTLFAATVAVLLVGGAGSIGLALLRGAADETRRAEGRATAAALGLTDVALFGEARYTRHPSQADLASAFQDGPAVLDHFPAGSLVRPPHDFGRGSFTTEEPIR